jgi:hypothetical protein
MDNYGSHRVVALFFSKNRALQLEAAIRTFTGACLDLHGVEIRVVYKATTERHLLQYAALAESWPGIYFHPETSFREDLAYAVRGASHLLFLVDDNLFVKPFSLDKILKVFDNHPEALGFSFRLGKNIVYHYPTRTIQQQPVFHDVYDGICLSNWTISKDYFAYPLEISSSLYRNRDIAPLLASGRYSNPNTLEAMLHGACGLFKKIVLFSFISKAPQPFAIH